MIDVSVVGRVTDGVNTFDVEGAFDDGRIVGIVCGEWTEEAAHDVSWDVLDVVAESIGAAVWNSKVYEDTYQRVERCDDDDFNDLYVAALRSWRKCVEHSRIGNAGQSESNAPAYVECLTRLAWYAERKAYSFKPEDYNSTEVLAWLDAMTRARRALLKRSMQPHVFAPFLEAARVSQSLRAMRAERLTA